MKFLVLMPTFNERQNLENSVLQVLQAVPGINLLIIDDNSPDGTGAIADKLSEEHSAVSVLHRESKKGLGRAYLDGFTWAAKNSFDFVIQMDADGSHQPKNLSDLISKARPNRLVIGSRWIPGGRGPKLALVPKGYFKVRQPIRPKNAWDESHGHDSRLSPIPSFKPCQMKLQMSAQVMDSDRDDPLLLKRLRL